MQVILKLYAILCLIVINLTVMYFVNWYFKVVEAYIIHLNYKVNKFA